MTSPRDESPTGTSRTLSQPVVTSKKVLIVFGTRPEAIKLCPLVAAVRTPALHLEAKVCVSAQHRRMLDQVLTTFGVQPDYDLDIMQPNQSLTTLTARLLSAMEPVIANEEPAMVVVQGDTTTAFGAALAAFYARVPVAHVEAGLRTRDIYSPFPEEMNRLLLGRMATRHFPATNWAAENLRREGVAGCAIRVTGNTGIDAVLSVREAITAGKVSGLKFATDPNKKLIVVTAHRRESFGAGLHSICDAISDLAAREDVQIVWPVHPNPSVREVVDKQLREHSNVMLIEPLDYVPFVDLMTRAYLLITDSGGVQEEGPSLGKPVLVLREKTERPEGVDAGTAKLVGRDRARIVSAAARLLNEPAEYERMSRRHDPYGDGKASERIAQEISSFLRQ